MGISESDFRAMQDRANRGMKRLQPSVATSLTKPNFNQKEVGKEGIQDEIEAWLMTQSHRAWWDCKRTDKATTSRKGVPDFIGVFDGVAFGMEVKRPGGKPTVEQLGELTWMRKAGAKTAIVYSKEEAVKFLTSLKHEHTTSTIEGQGSSASAETRHRTRVPPEADIQAATAAADRILSSDRAEDLHHPLNGTLRAADDPANNPRGAAS